MKKLLIILLFFISLNSKIQALNKNIKVDYDLHDLFKNENLIFTPELIKTLKNAGVKFNERDCLDCTPLDYLFMNTSLFANENLEFTLKLIKSLKDAGVNFNEQSMVVGCTPLHYLFKNLKKLTPELIKSLKDAEVDFNTKDKFDCTPLHNLFNNLKRLTPELIKSLKDAEVDFNTKDEFGCTPLHYFFKNGNLEELTPELIESFENVEVDFNIENKNGCTPLDYLFENESFFADKNLKKLTPELIEMFLVDKKTGKIRKNFINEETQKYISELILTFQSLQKDFITFYRQGCFTDIEIETKDKDKNIKFHSLVLLSLFNVNKEEKQKFLNSLENICGRHYHATVNLFFLWAYGYDLSEKETEELEPIFNCLNENNINVKKLKDKNGKIRLLKTLNRLYTDEINFPKDFVIIVNDKEILVHKIILIARSRLYKEMFLSCREGIDLNKIQDYSEKSLETLKKLVEFFYLDQLKIKEKQNKREKIINELNDIFDYYQLNINSTLLNEINLYR